MGEQIFGLAVTDVVIVGADEGDELARQRVLEASTIGGPAAFICRTGSTMATSSTGMKMTMSGLSPSTCATKAVCSSTSSGCFGTKCAVVAPLARAT